MEPTFPASVVPLAKMIVTSLQAPASPFCVEPRRKG